MGTKAAPTIANIFMAEINEEIQKCAILANRNVIHFYKRFIDDIFIIWTGTVPQFKTFMERVNHLHKTIKFTSENNIEKNSTTFLDTTVTIKNRKVMTDLYRKETDKVQYLLPSSCHPSHIFKNVPYFLA
jgi:peptide-methionine (R)-S-oxide reductase